jgi:hypothetical protein
MSQPQADPIPWMPLVPPKDGVIPFKTAHDNMRTGDLLFWHGDYLISRLFERATGSYYSHAAIAAWCKGHLILLQAEALGIEAVPLHVTVAKYPGRVDWFRLTVDALGLVDMDAVLRRAQKYLGMRYGYFEVAKALAARVFGFGDPRDPKHPHAMFCSEYVATAFDSPKFRFTSRPAIQTFPQDIVGSGNVMRVGTIHPDPSMPKPGDAASKEAAKAAQMLNGLAQSAQGGGLDPVNRGGKPDDVAMQ